MAFPRCSKWWRATSAGSRRARVGAALPKLGPFGAVVGRPAEEIGGGTVDLAWDGRRGRRAGRLPTRTATRSRCSCTGRSSSTSRGACPPAGSWCSTAVPPGWRCLRLEDGEGAWSAIIDEYGAARRCQRHRASGGRRTRLVAPVSGEADRRPRRESEVRFAGAQGPCPSRPRARVAADRFEANRGAPRPGHPWSCRPGGDPTDSGPVRPQSRVLRRGEARPSEIVLFGSSPPLPCRSRCSSSTVAPAVAGERASDAAHDVSVALLAAVLGLVVARHLGLERLTRPSRPVSDPAAVLWLRRFTPVGSCSATWASLRCCSSGCSSSRHRRGG